MTTKTASSDLQQTSLWVCYVWFCFIILSLFWHNVCDVVMVNSKLVTTGDTGTCAQHCCCHGNSKGLVDGVIIRWSKWWVVGGRDGVQGGGRWIKVWGRWDARRHVCAQQQQRQRRRGKSFFLAFSGWLFFNGPLAAAMRKVSEGRTANENGWTPPRTLNALPARLQAVLAELIWETSLFFCSFTPLPFPLVLLLTANLCFYITVVSHRHLIPHLILQTSRSMKSSDFAVPLSLCQ